MLNTCIPEAGGLQPASLDEFLAASDSITHPLHRTSSSCSPYHRDPLDDQPNIENRTYPESNSFEIQLFIGYDVVGRIYDRITVNRFLFVPSKRQAGANRFPCKLGREIQLYPLTTILTLELLEPCSPPLVRLYARKRAWQCGPLPVFLERGRSPILPGSRPAKRTCGTRGSWRNVWSVSALGAFDQPSQKLHPCLMTSCSIDFQVPLLVLSCADPTASRLVL